MSQQYQKLARQIIQSMGGKENILDVYHCQTRLRFKLKDASLVQKSELENLDGVAMYLVNAGVHQVVIGTHVKSVFEEVEPLIDLKNSSSESSDEVTSPVQ